METDTSRDENLQRSHDVSMDRGQCEVRGYMSEGINVPAQMGVEDKDEELRKSQVCHD